MAAAESSTSIRFPDRAIGPLGSFAWRIGVAVGSLLVATVLVYAGRSGYRDNNGVLDSWLGALYYATVSLSTTGYGDITPVSAPARLVNVFAITPLRLLFLIVLVGTTIEVLTRRTRQAIRTTVWRKTVHNHVIIVGFGVKGGAAMRAMIEQGRKPGEFVVIDRNDANVAAAVAAGAVGVHGDSTREAVLQQAGIGHAQVMVICVDRDDTAVLSTLTGRRLAPSATIVTSVREAQNLSVLRQSGADVVIPTAESAGRILGLSTTAPRAGAVLEDLLEPGVGLEIVERAVTDGELGKRCAELIAGGEIVLEVNRAGRSHRFNSPGLGALVAGDRLVVIRSRD